MARKLAFLKLRKSKGEVVVEVDRQDLLHHLVAEAAAVVVDLDGAHITLPLVVGGKSITIIW